MKNGKLKRGYSWYQYDLCINDAVTKLFQVTHGPRRVRTSKLDKLTRLHELIHMRRHVSGKHRIARIKRVFEANIEKLTNLVSLKA